MSIKTMSIRKKTDELLGQIEHQIDRGNKLLNYDPYANMQEEMLRHIDILYNAGRLIEELSGGAKSGKRT